MTLVLSTPSSGQEPEKKLLMAVGLSLPPYVFRETDSGMELDIVREALGVRGYSIKPYYLPLKRVEKSLRTKTVDGALTVRESMGIESVYFADTSHIYYQNVAVSLEENHFGIHRMMDLKDYRVIVFQNADDYIGKEWMEMKDIHTKGIKEMANQESQVAMLFEKRTDVIVLDINIFKFYRKTTKKTDTSAPVVIHEVVPKNNVKVAFVSEKVRNDFNIGLAQIRASGVYEKIIQTYTGR